MKCNLKILLNFFVLFFRKRCAFFGLFDGHAGKFASEFCATNFPDKFQKICNKSKFLILEFLFVKVLDVLPEKNFIALAKSLKRSFIETYKSMDEEFLNTAKNRLVLAITSKFNKG